MTSTGVVPQLSVSCCTVRSLWDMPMIREWGRNRAIERTVKPVPEMARMVEMPSPSAARHAAMVMASVIEAASWVESSVMRSSARRSAHSSKSNSSSARWAMRSMVRTTLAGSLPTAVSPESISAEEPSNTALATSLASARVGDGRDTIDSSIWVAVITGTAARDALLDDLLLQVGQLLDAALAAEVAAGHHDRPGGVDDAGQVLHRGPGLDLGHQQRAPRMGLGADPADVVGRADERYGHDVHAELDEGVEGDEVAGGGRGHPQPVGGDVHAGAARQGAAVGRHAHLEAVAALVDHVEHHPPVAHVEAVAHQHVVHQSLVVHLHDAAGRAAAADHQLYGACPEWNSTGSSPKLAALNLGPGQVHQDPHRPALLLGDAADAPVALDGLVEGSVSHADAGNVHARGNHVGQRGLALAGRADRGDDLGAALQ